MDTTAFRNVPRQRSYGASPSDPTTAKWRRSVTVADRPTSPFLALLIHCCEVDRIFAKANAEIQRGFTATVSGEACTPEPPTVRRALDE